MESVKDDITLKFDYFISRTALNETLQKYFVTELMGKILIQVIGTSISILVEIFHWFSVQAMKIEKVLLLVPYIRIIS